MRLLTFAAMMLAASATATAQPPAGPPAIPSVRPPGAIQQPSTTIMAEPVAVMLSGFDGNGDGRVTRAECEAGVTKSFAALDTDHKGSLGYIAFADWAEQWLGDRNALPSPFETDTDGDNRITLAELQAKIATIFDRLDKNKDGVLVHGELLTLDGARGFGGFGGPDRPRRGPPRR